MKTLEEIITELSPKIGDDNLGEVLELVQNEITERDNMITKSTEDYNSLRNQFTARFMYGGEQNATQSATLTDDNNIQDAVFTYADGETSDMEEIKDAVTINDILEVKED